MSKKSAGSGGVAVDDLRDEVSETRARLGDTTQALADKADSARRPVRMGAGAALATLVAAVAAVGAWRWRKARQTPKGRAKRAWRDVKGRARDVRKDVRSRARDVKSRLS